MHLTIPVETLVLAIFGGLCVVELFASMSVLELLLIVRLTLLASIVYTLYTSMADFAEDIQESEPIVFAVPCSAMPCPCCIKKEVAAAPGAAPAAAAAEPEPETEVYERELEPTTEFSDLIRNPL